MQTNSMSSAEGSTPVHTFTERRAKARISELFAAKVKGTDSAGESFVVDAVVENISASGLYLRLKQPINHGTVLRILLRMDTADANSTSPDGDGAPRIALRGVVVRIESVSREDFGLGIAIEENFFL